MRILLALLVVTLPLITNAEELVVYSARKDHLIKPVFSAFEQETGIKVKHTTGKAGQLLQKLKMEGSKSPADILITVDAGNLWQATEQNLLQPIESQILNEAIPTAYRDPQGRWFGFSLRARTIVYNPTKVQPKDLSTYEALAENRWKNKLCLRTSKKVYNQSLVATMIKHLGETQTQEVLSGWVNNLAAPVFSSDSKMMEAIAAGQCDVGIGNTYYFGRLKKKNPGIKLALFWPNQTSRGVHVNISGAGVTRFAKNRQQAQKFLEWLASPKAQKIFADQNMEYPVVTGVQIKPFVKSWGDFKADKVPLVTAGELQAQAVRVMDQSKYR